MFTSNSNLQIIQRADLTPQQGENKPVFYFVCKANENKREFRPLE